MENKKKLFCLKKYTRIFCCLILFLTTNIYAISTFCQNGEKSKYLNSFEKESKNEVKKMIEILNDTKNKKNNPKIIFEAIATLERLQDPLATSALMDYLDYEKVYGAEAPHYSNGIHLVSLISRYPALGALFSIGKSALPSLIAVIESEESDSIRSQNALYTVQCIFRGELKEGIEYLEKSMNKSITNNGKSRLKKAVDQTKERLLKTSNIIKEKQVNK